MSKGLSTAEQRYSNIEQEALDKVHGQEKSHYYCFAKEVNMITEHKLLVAIVSKNVTTLSQ